jgi:hypothetical protein
MPNGQNIRRVVQQARSLLTNKNIDDIPKSLASLILNPRNRRIVFRGRLSHRDKTTNKLVGFKSFIVDKNLTFDGITTPLGEIAWSSYAAPPVKDVDQPGVRSTTGCYSGGSGKSHGTKVHKDFERLVKVIRGHLQKKNGDFNVGHVDPCAYRMLTALVNRKIIPIYAEYVVFDEYAGLATAIDCLAWDISNDTFIAVEIKTGHVKQLDYAAVCGKAHFRQPLEFIPDSPLNRAATQLLVSVLFIARRYGVQVDRGVILRPLSTSNQVQMYEMPPWALDKNVQGSIYSLLRSYVTSGANTRRVVKRTGMGERQRAALERQESRRTLLETGPDPSADIFWNPQRQVVRIPTVDSIMKNAAPPVSPSSAWTKTIASNAAVAPPRWKGKGKMVETDAPPKPTTTTRRRPTIPKTPSPEVKAVTTAWCNTMNSPHSSILTTNKLSWRSEIQRA